MIEAGLYSVDVWADFENVDESGCLLASAADVHDESLLALGKVLVAFDDGHVALAAVVGKVRRGSETRFRLALAPGDIDEYARPLLGRSATRARSDHEVV